MQSIKQILDNPDAGRDPKANQELKQAQAHITGPEPNEPSESPQSSCPDCQDTGWRQIEVEDSRGKHSSTVRCECRRERIIRAALPVRYQGARLSDFPLDAGIMVSDWLAKPTDGLFITGGTGTGKTHLAAAILRYQFEHGRRAIFRRAAQLYQVLRDSYGKDNALSEEAIMSEYIDAPFLILDDLGAGSLSDHERRCTLEVLDRRMNALLPTVVTSNWTAIAIGGRMDDRVGSRLSSYTLIEFAGKDWRATE